MTTEETTYVLGWNSKHPQHKTLNEIHERLVMADDAIPSPISEPLRAVVNLVYEWCNNGNCNAADQIEVECHSCEGSGYEEGDWNEEDNCYEMKDCGWCGGECTIPDGMKLSRFGKEMVDIIEQNVPYIDEELAAVKALILGDKNYKYDYDDNENAVYNALTEKILAWAIQQDQHMQGFENWKNSDNVIKKAEDEYRTQCTQYGKAFTLAQLKEYFRKEFSS